MTRLDEVNLLLEKQPSIELLKSHIGFFFECSEEDFIKEYEDNLESLKELILEFKTWINEKLKENDYISILGI
ncbi:hypothetical protein NQ117_06510 [Paenibacillus sp. SC116]|uniref:hypothetical protein n=1 Tax=Paenibacillus sp. SC116 TaxID=2968986 RepID=UPI00215AEA16|nr:hypothetical protein [Paenibacillus sp. SC116]MCR8843330.1 hypothetical protein [Paenibacillus sp. SC116]